LERPLLRKFCVSESLLSNESGSIAGEIFVRRNLHRNKTAISTMLIAGIVIAVIVVAGVAGYYLSTQNSPSPSASPSPTSSSSSTPQASTAAPSASSNPTASPTAAPSQTPSTSIAANVTGASSLQYSVSVTTNGASEGSYTYSGKNAGTQNFMMRIDFFDPSGNETIYIINNQLQKSWAYSDGNWTDLSAVYSLQYNTWNTLWHGYVTSLATWSGLGDYTYSANGTSVRIYDIHVNPTLPDSQFVVG
jgi:hypothetical protein